jgi:hypothetical protein
MTTSHEFNDNPQQYAEQLLRQNQEALAAAVAIISPETPDADPLTVLPAPGELRAEDQGLNLTTEQESQLRIVAAEFGFGRETDLTLGEQGIRGAHVIIEGGQAHKVMAEALMVLEDKVATPSTLIFTATPYRNITNVEERISTSRLLGHSNATEYDMVHDLITSLPGFEPNEEIELPMGYDIHDEFTVSDQANGQFKLLGTINNAPVVLLRVDREEYAGDDGTTKYRKQPNTADIMSIVDGISAMQGDELLPVAFVTSATYQPSRMLDAVAVGLRTGRPMGIATYGTARLAAVKGKGEATPAPAPINQLPGELHKMALETQKLEAAIQQ